MGQQDVIAKLHPIIHQYVGLTTEVAVDRAIFLADRAYELIAADCWFNVAAGGGSVLQLTKETGTTAVGAGTDLLDNNTQTGWDLNATAKTIQAAVFQPALGKIVLQRGDRLSIDFANTIQSTAGLVISLTLKPLLP